jgi:PAS domain S-box-containing protein
VQRQHAGAPPEPWQPQTPVDAPLVPVGDLQQACQERWDDTSDHVIVTDEASIILRATRPVLDALGYDDEADLVGRRILVVVPERFHQAHVAGTALHSTNGRSHLIGRSVLVPVVRADGGEMLARVCVEPTHVAGDRRVFVADLRSAADTDAPAGSSGDRARVG